MTPPILTGSGRSTSSIHRDAKVLELLLLAAIWGAVPLTFIGLALWAVLS